MRYAQGLETAVGQQEGTSIYNHYIILIYTIAEYEHQQAVEIEVILENKVPADTKKPLNLMQINPWTGT